MRLLDPGTGPVSCMQLDREDTCTDHTVVLGGEWLWTPCWCLLVVSMFCSCEWTNKTKGKKKQFQLPFLGLFLPRFFLLGCKGQATRETRWLALMMCSRGIATDNPFVVQSAIPAILFIASSPCHPSSSSPHLLLLLLLLHHHHHHQSPPTSPSISHIRAGAASPAASLYPSTVLHYQHEHLPNCPQLRRGPTVRGNVDGFVPQAWGLKRC